MKKSQKTKVKKIVKKATPRPSTDFKPSTANLADAPQRAKKILATLKKNYPNAKIALEYADPLELLVATVLSAQCTDKRVNLITPQLFKKYRSAEDFANSDQGQLEEDIKSTGFFRSKATSIRAACDDIITRHSGQVPATMEELTKLRGVGRKTANCILGNAFGIPGITTDTHVIRLSRLMGLSKQTDPVKLEFELMELFPKKDWTLASHLLISHGRQICIARRPDCANCPVRRYCSYGVSAEKTGGGK